MNNVETYIKIATKQLELAGQCEVVGQIIDHQNIAINNLLKAVEVIARLTGMTSAESNEGWQTK